MATITVNGNECESGCWIDGHWGQYGPIRQIEITDQLLETEFMDQLCMLTAEFVPENSHSAYPKVDMDDVENIFDVSDRAEEALNAATPDDFSWGWHDGEYFLWSQETWEEE